MKPFSVVLAIALAIAVALPSAASTSVPNPGFGTEPSLYEIYNEIYDGTPGFVPLTSNQELHDNYHVYPADVWVVLSSGGGPVSIEARFAGLQSTFGYYNPPGAVAPAYTAMGTVTSQGYNPTVAWTPGFAPPNNVIPDAANPFGLFMLAGGQYWHSEEALNPGGFNALRVYKAPAGHPVANEYVFAWEDRGAAGDRDFNDLVLTISNVRVIPEPTSMLLLGLGLAGAAVRRLRKQSAA